MLLKYNQLYCLRLSSVNGEQSESENQTQRDTDRLSPTVRVRVILVDTRTVTFDCGAKLCWRLSRHCSDCK